MFAAVISGCTTKKSEDAGITLHDIELNTLEGRELDLSQFEGKVLFVNFWATWCRPCVEEMPSIERAKNQLPGDKIEFLFASNEEVDDILKFRDKRGLNLHYVLAGNMEELKIEALPTTMIVNPNGEIVFSEIGFRRWDDSSNLELITQIINNR